MPDHAGLVVEGSGLDLRGGDAGDTASEGKHVGGDVAELGVLIGGRRRRRARADGGGIGEVDAGVPEAVA